MATKVPSKTRMSFSLNTGTHPTQGTIIKRSVSISNIMPSAGVNAIGTVATAIKTLFFSPCLMVSLVETSEIV